MLPINKSDVCRRMLDTGKYQLSSSKIVEDVWLIAWLKSKGVGYDDAFEKWKRIYVTRHPDDETAKAVFDKLWMNSRRIKFINKYKPIVFYQQEIDEIVKADVPVWQKEAFVLIYAVAKAVGSSELSVLPISDIIRMTSLTFGYNGYEPHTVVQSAQNAGFLCLREVRLWDDVTGQPDVFLQYTLPRIQTSGNVYKNVRSILDVPDEIFPDIQECICVDCGMPFKQSKKGKRSRCQECYKIYRKKYIKNAVEKYRVNKKTGFPYMDIE